MVPYILSLKPFRFLGINVCTQRISLRRSCNQPHVRIEGAYTKKSATYVPKLVEALALTFVQAIQQVCQRRVAELEIETSGLENQLVNEVALASQWKVLNSWKFKKMSHINILEEASILRLVNYLGRMCKPLRAVALVDSFVVRGATSKGRSSSRALSAILRRVGAATVAFGVYLTLPFVPTRWNPADDPTRDVELREVYGSLGIDGWEEDEIYMLSELPKSRKWASMWMRMVLRLLGPVCLYLADRSLYRQSKLCPSQEAGYRHTVMDFDSSMGFPGEGPFSLVLLSVIFVIPACISFLSNFGLCASGFLSLSCPILFIWIAAGWGRVLCLPRVLCPPWAVDFCPVCFRWAARCHGDAYVPKDTWRKDQGGYQTGSSSCSAWAPCAPGYTAQEGAASG